MSELSAFNKICARRITTKNGPKTKKITLFVKNYLFFVLG